MTSLVPRLSGTIQDLPIPGRRWLCRWIAWVDFITCYQSRLEVEVDGLIINFIDLENLKKNKKATGRLQDLADLDNLAGKNT